MKAFEISFRSDFTDGYELLVAGTKEEALEIMKEKYRGFEKTGIREVSLDKVRLKDLTVADLIRIIK